MSIFNEVGEQIQDTLNSTNLKFATRDSRSKSEEIKTSVREKMSKLSSDKKKGNDYENLLKIQNEIEANHDKIYLRPNTGVSASQAVEDCEKILSNQEDLEIKFNFAFAKITNDQNLYAETNKLQNDRKIRDEKSAETKKIESDHKKNNDAVDAALDAINKAKANVESLKENITYTHEDLGNKIKNTIEDVKDEFKTPKPRP